MTEYIGFDLSKEETAFCVMDADKRIVAEGKVATQPEALVEAVRAHSSAPERIVVETGTQSAWLVRGLAAAGLPVELLDARQVHNVLKLMPNKTDAKDARMLAEIALSGLARPVAAKSAEAQQLRGLLGARTQLMRQGRNIENMIRGLLSTMGLNVAKGRGKFAGRVEAHLRERPDLEAMIRPLLIARASVMAQADALEAEITAQAKACPACRLLMTIPGIGPITALGFVATIDDPERFADSRDVAAYLGLTPRRFQSGERDVSGPISKRGDSLMRSLLFEAASNLLTRVKRGHPLKDWARRIQRRSGAKKAKVALARKLAVIAHRMLVTGEMFRWPEPTETPAPEAA